MTNPSLFDRPFRSTTVLFATLAIGLLSLSACASTPSATGTVSHDMSTSPPSPDPRIGLAAGQLDAGQAAWNMTLLSSTPPAEGFVGVTNSDLAFSGNYVYQGNYNGYQVWDVSNPRQVTLKTSYLCPASQSDVSVYKHLLFVSGEGQSGRTDCGAQGVQDSVSAIRLRGIRIFDVSDVMNPKYVANVQTCRGSHTHTVASDPRDDENVYIYVSGSSRVRSPSELPGCSGLSPEEDPNSALFRIEVIRVPLANPEQAAIVSSPRIFNDLAAPPRRGQPARAGGQRRPVNAAAAARRRTGPTQCHDITTYPEVGLAGGACGGYGLLLDISDVANPRRIDAAADSNMSFWHSATFSNDGDKVLFSDEWGGGRGARCRAEDDMKWGANALFTIENRRMNFKTYYKMPAAQTEWENCVAHNGSLIPIPDREVMVQAWYQGGISVFDWTDVNNPKEIAFFDRGPLEDGELTSAGSWSVYWYNGNIISSEIARGLDVLALNPSA
ncbi:MAG TPA: hypothetical protein VHG09_04525, partial [Longimicrobiales bacterium]|nr:hypothetical protein [Longimicrobiales bacterium]